MGTKIDKDEKKRIKAEAKANAKAKKAATEKVKTKKFSFMKKNCKKKGSSSFKWKMFFKNPATGKKGLSFVSRIAIVIIIPVLVASTIITVFDTNALTKGLTDSAYEGLEGIAKCVTAGYNTADESNYYVSNNKHLRKGHYDLTERLDVIDSYAADEDLDISLYYGSTCMITSLIDPATGERVINTEAPEEVVKTVLENGQVYRDDNVKMNGHVYSVVYVPIIQDEDDIVGMVCAGRYQETISSAVNEERNKTILIELIIVVIAAVFAVIIARGFSKCITITEDSIKTMSDGDLTKPADSKVMKRTDEIGSMLVALENMRQRLTTILSGVAGYAEDIHNVSETVDNMTGQADNAVGEISKAIEDISHGAMSQADEVEDANTSMITMGSQVDDIANGVKLLDVSAANMKAASDKALAIMDELAKSTERTTDAIDLIGNQVVMTNKSVAEIRNAVNMITDIASQTNLLSLNASIEAARAGEQGKGFAVVASEIQKLSDQSNQSAITIGEIIAELGRKSEETVKEMNNAQEIVKEQQENLVLTKEKFAAVDAEIDASRREAKNIKERTDICTESKGRVVDVMSNLSALSEENAASTEETTASIQEINANINIVAQNAVKLNELAAKLVEGIRYFKLS